MRLEYLYIVLALVCVVVFVLIWIRVLNWLCIKMSDWPSMAARFPSQSFGQTGEVYKAQMGTVGKMRMRRGFRIELFEEGLKITPRFAKSMPLFVPWSRLVSVESVPFSVLVTLDSAGNTHFYLPRAAFDCIRSRVRPEVLR
jgi:hypothetical protein